MLDKQINILVVDDRWENLLVMESILENMECNIIKATSGNEALGLMLEYDFALALLDVQMPGMDGFEVAELMRGMEKTRYIPIIFVTAISKEQRCIFKGYEIGAVDYLFKPIEPVILTSKVRVFMDIYKQKQLLKEQSEQLEQRLKELLELKAVNGELECLLTLDPLTEITNRRRLDQLLELNWRNSLRDEKPISMIMIDIDNFKAYNDNYGHLKGDECLVKVARSFETILRRPLDFTARYGGEEFAVVLPNTDMEGAVMIGERIRSNVEKLSIPHHYSKVAPHVTISLGVATMIPNIGGSVTDLIEYADRALYQSKFQGRNRISVHTDQGIINPNKMGKAFGH